MNNNNTNNHPVIMSSSILLIPFIVLFCVALLSLVWHGGTLVFERLNNQNSLIAHAVITFILFLAYYLIIKTARNAITALQLKNNESAQQLESQRKLLQLETYQHQKTGAQLYELKTQDPLTQIYNQTYFKELLKNEIEKSTRYSSDFSLLIIELDNFIQINERYGNEFGNYAMKKFTDLIGRRLRKSDLLARYGQYNLAIIAPSTTTDSSKLFAIRLCESIEVSTVSYEGVPIRMTLSIGVGGPSAVDNMTVDSLTIATKKALAAAVERGGNRVIDANYC